MICLSVTVKKAQNLMRQKKWNKALAVWKEAADMDSTYEFQVKACKLIVTAVQMQNEIPERRPVLMVLGGK